MKINKYILLALVSNVTFLFAQTEVKEYREVQPVVQEEAIEDENVPFAVIDEVPQFEACKDLTGKDGKNCFEQEMNKHIKNNIQYPEQAQEADIQGRVMVRFVINKNGEIENIYTRGPINGELLEKEAIRILKLLPKFKPATQKGKNVNVSYIIPINFVLPKEIETEE